VKKASHRKGHVTFRTAAALFALSSLLELAGMTLPAPLFGEFRGGTAALVYHLSYVLLFLALAVGLWTAKPWGYLMIFIGGVFYTIDKLQFLMSGNVTQELVNTVFRGQEPLLQAVGPGTVMLSLTLVVLTFVLGWWGFAYYAYLCRSYFRGSGG
jgi:hypothetical protein